MDESQDQIDKYMKFYRNGWAKRLAKMVWPFYERAWKINKIKNRHIFLIGQSHIDAAWVWRKKYTISKVLKTFRNAATNMRIFPNYIFNTSSPQYFEWVLEFDKELFNEIKNLVNENRWILVGGSWIEPDCNIPDGESFCRQRLYGQLFFKEHFGKYASVEWFLDSFGYSNGLPQILKKSAAKAFWTSKIKWNRKFKFPFNYFYWKGPDGSKILTNNCEGGWGPAMSFRSNPENYQLLKDSNFQIPNFNYSIPKEEIVSFLSSPPKYMPYIGIFYGKGDGGHGPWIKEIVEAESLNNLKRYEISSADTFFHKIEEYSHLLPTWSDELSLDIHRGTFTTHSYMKWLNRRAEIALITTEKFIEILFLNKIISNNIHEKLKKVFNSLWKALLFNQFHDILPGTSIPGVYIETYSELETLIWYCYWLLHKYLHISSRKMMSNDSFNNEDNKAYAYNNIFGISFFNPMSWSRNEFLEIKLPLYPSTTENLFNLGRNIIYFYENCSGNNNDEGTNNEPSNAMPSNNKETYNTQNKTDFIALFNEMTDKLSKDLTTNSTMSILQKFNPSNQDLKYFKDSNIDLNHPHYPLFSDIMLLALKQNSNSINFEEYFKNLMNIVDKPMVLGFGNQLFGFFDVETGIILKEPSILLLPKINLAALSITTHNLTKLVIDSYNYDELVEFGVNFREVSANSKFIISNEFFILELNSDNGSIISLRDNDGFQYISADKNEYLLNNNIKIYADDNKKEPAWNIDLDYLNKEIKIPNSSVYVEIIEYGPRRFVVSVCFDLEKIDPSPYYNENDSELNKSTIRLYYIVRAGIQYLEIAVDFQSIHPQRFIKFDFKPSFSVKKMLIDGPYSIRTADFIPSNPIDKNRIEKTCQKYVNLVCNELNNNSKNATVNHDKKNNNNDENNIDNFEIKSKVHGLAIITYDKYGFSNLNKRFQLSLLRTPDFPPVAKVQPEWPENLEWKQPDIDLALKEKYPQVDIGHSYTRFAIFPYYGNNDDVFAISEQYNNPLLPYIIKSEFEFLKSKNQSQLSSRNNLQDIAIFNSELPSNVKLSVIKAAESCENASVLRFIEIVGRTTDVLIDLSKLIQIREKQNHTIKKVLECNILEESIGDKGINTSTTIKFSSESISFTMDPFEIKTIKIFWFS